jgi:hypothetical protein
LGEPVQQALARLGDGIGGGDAAGLEAKLARLRLKARLESGA